MSQNNDNSALLANAERSPRKSRNRQLVTIVTFAAALVPACTFWGFTVDDALITARMAHHLATGIGYRFNPGGPIVDAVTPLGFAHVLSVIAEGDPLHALLAAKVLGLAAWSLAAVWLGREFSKLASGARIFVVIAVLALCVPLAVWSVAGMETGVVIALATLAVSEHRFATLAAGIAAALRPELLPWASVLAIGRGLSTKSPHRAIRELALATMPALMVAGIRVALFGRAAPLAVFAKPSDLEHGLRYAFGAFVFTGVPILLLAPRAFLVASSRTKILVLAVATHWLSLIVAGGDWMAFFRLATPVLPGAFLAAAELAQSSGRLAFAVRGALASTGACVLLLGRGPAARQIMDQRAQLIAEARPALAGARSIASVDVGWVGIASSSNIVDLAGVTDPNVAFLPGGHTTKVLTEQFLEARATDGLVLLLNACEVDRAAWWTARFSRGVEQRIASFELAKQFEVRKLVRLRGTDQCYVILRRMS